MKKESQKQEYDIDLAGIFSVEEMQELLKETLPLPAYYGGTLDALYDVLTDEGMAWTIRFSGTATAEAILGKYMRNLKKMGKRVNMESDEERIFFED